MHFGRIENTSGFQAVFPNTPDRTKRFLNLCQGVETKMRVGCPIWASKNWVGELYPEGTKPTDFLKHYSKIFDTVEVNSLFYQLLDENRIREWKDKVTPSFRFCPKVFRGITEGLTSPHLETLVHQFCKTIEIFGENLGLTFAQFHEGFSPRDFEKLVTFVRVWPKGIPLAIELRHPKWFSEHALLDTVINFFYKEKVSTVVTDTIGKPEVLHLSLTQPKLLVRFQGNEGQPLDDVRLTNWADRLSVWRGQNLEEVYFFVHQPTDPLIPITAATMKEKLADKGWPLTAAFFPAYLQQSLL